MPHEQSVTLGFDDEFFVFSSIHKGKKLSDKEISDLFRSKQMKPLLGPFKTIQEANDAAKKRSESFDPRKFPGSGSLLRPSITRQVRST